jgi:glycerophosphoryl diester phosphodiesterase
MRPQVIAHRGASGYRPEHTLAAYALAVELGADALEVDVVMTSDGRVVCRHEHQLRATTDVSDHPELAGRRVTRQVSGRSQDTGWFSEDLTLTEVRSLRARERLGPTRPASAAYDGTERVPLLTEVLDLVLDVRRTRQLPLLIEVKHPQYFTGIGLPILEAVLADLESRGLDGPDAEVVVESFEPTALTWLAERTQLPLMQLLEEPLKRPADLFTLGDPRTFGDLVAPQELLAMSGYARHLGVHTDLVFPRDRSGAVRTPSTLVGDAHELGLEVSVFTLRAENRFLPTNLRLGDDSDARGALAAQVAALAATGVDGLMTDFPDLVLEALGENRDP